MDEPRCYDVKIINRDWKESRMALRLLATTEMGQELNSLHVTSRPTC